MVVLERIDEADVMEEDGGASVFPVVFFDGEREVNIGNLKVYPTLEFKPFLTAVSHVIGISHNQISIYLVDRNLRKIPITRKVNFGLICRQKHCSFLVVLKKSRKSRNLREKMINNVNFADNGFYPPSLIPVPANSIFLRMNHPVPFYGHIMDLGLAELNYRLMVIQKENYNYQMAMNTNLNSLMMMDNIRRASEASIKEMVMAETENNNGLCEECDNVKDGNTTASFHACISDEVIITPFRTRFGPISRPIKRAC